MLPGVDVTVTQTETGFSRSAVTDENGSYTLTNLPIGPYRLQAMLAGFRTYQQTGIVLQVGSSPVVPVELGIGALSETVSVEAAMDPHRVDPRRCRRQVVVVQALGDVEQALGSLG